jgi:hypothetical protein
LLTEIPIFEEDQFIPSVEYAIVSLPLVSTQPINLVGDAAKYCQFKLVGTLPIVQLSNPSVEYEWLEVTLSKNITCLPIVEAYALTAGVSPEVLVFLVEVAQTVPVSSGERVTDVCEEVTFNVLGVFRVAVVVNPPFVVTVIADGEVITYCPAGIAFVTVAVEDVMFPSAQTDVAPGGNCEVVPPAEGAGNTVDPIMKSPFRLYGS